MKILTAIVTEIRLLVEIRKLCVMMIYIKVNNISDNDEGK